MKKSVLLILASIICIGSFAQIESTLSFMSNIPQSIDNNPAVISKYKYVIGLPLISSFGGMFSSNGLSYKNIYETENGINTIPLTKILSKSSKTNYLQLSAQIDFLRFVANVSPNIFVSFSSSLKGFGRIKIDKETISLFAKGNASLIENSAVLSPEVDALTYIDTNFGFAIKLTDQFSIGGRIKLIQGLHNLTSRISSSSITTTADYELVISAELSTLTSGLEKLPDGSYSRTEINKLLFKNLGTGIDLGMVLKPNNKLILQASIVDIGFINWKNNPYERSINSGEVKFSGTEIGDLLSNSDSPPSYLGEFWRQNEDKFKINEKESDSYSTMLPIKAYFSGKYEIKENLNVGALVFVEQFKKRILSGLTLGVIKDFGKWVSTSLTYTLSNRSYFNLGLGASINLTPVQLYIVGDNLLNSAFIKSVKLYNFRMGINVAWGGELKKMKKPINRKRGVR